MLIDKVTFRRKCKEKLQNSAKKSKFYKDKMVEKKLKYIMKILKPKTILLYLPMKLEVNIGSFTRDMRKKCNIFVPFMEGVSFKIVKYRLPLREKRFSIKEPPSSSFKQKSVEVAVVPVLGVGRDNKRVGFGKGMYDRFFANLKCRPIIIFVQIEECYDKKVSTDTFDIQSDFYVTPKKIYITRGKKNVDKHINSCGRTTYRRSSRRNNTKEIRGIKI